MRHLLLLVSLQFSLIAGFGQTCIHDDLSGTLRTFEEHGFDYNLHAERKRGKRFQDVLIYCQRTGN